MCAGISNVDNVKTYISISAFPYNFTRGGQDQLIRCYLVASHPNVRRVQCLQCGNIGHTIARCSFSDAQLWGPVAVVAAEQDIAGLGDTARPSRVSTNSETRYGLESPIIVWCQCPQEHQDNRRLLLQHQPSFVTPIAIRNANPDRSIEKR